MHKQRVVSTHPSPENKLEEEETQSLCITNEHRYISTHPPPENKLEEEETGIIFE
ncbi:hypothetical protein [Evansella tamaricis]|uniref:Uncharacterized protein n=1 Tax=Evansella tamaricis TaxID=2069301 RepID=A0ABS6JE68_9BACI|nr:hypothetical protein [Evansella tamaricis]MBU9711142.1 hypothetical protein [Evansella tamaricis]